MHPVIERIYKDGTVKGRSGRLHQLHSTIDREEGLFISNIIKKDQTICNTLEIGCAFGLSSLYICLSLKERLGASHTIIDPYQKTQWDCAGIMNLERAGITFFNLIDKKSEFALPCLLKTMEGKFDLIFVDGWHTFDHTLLDCYYATRLLKVGGYITIDDVTFASVSRAVAFLTNYPCYEIFGAVTQKGAKSWKRSLARSLMFPVKRRIWAKILNPNFYRMIFNEFE